MKQRRGPFAAVNWFDPTEGTSRSSRLDIALAISLSVLSIVLCLAVPWLPVKYFDEGYFAGAGEDYLRHTEIIEFVHPPLTKLLIAFAMSLVGAGNGLSPQGDGPLGWRLPSVISGSLSVGLVYVFAKRITSSTLFATIAACLLLLDGFHYAQSRIAMPDVTVGFLALATLYAYYRFWLASQVHVRRSTRPGTVRVLWLSTICATPVALALALAAAFLWRAPNAQPDSGAPGAAFATAFAYFEILLYMAVRVLIARFRSANTLQATYAGGTRVEISYGHKHSTYVITAPDGTQGKAKTSSRLNYATPNGDAVFAPDGKMMCGNVSIDGRAAWPWLLTTCVMAGALTASKWNGLLDVLVIWSLAAFVAAQRFRMRPALYGNPRGI